MKFLRNEYENWLYLMILWLITISNISSAILDNSEMASSEQNLTKAIVDILDKKTVCWVCGKNIALKDLANFSCGHSTYHNNCVGKIDPYLSCPICLKPQRYSN